MNVIYTNNAAVIGGVAEFDPADIFENGQAFRFARQPDGAYAGVAHGRFLNVSKQNDGIVLYPCPPEDFETIWRHYFDLDRDYAALFCDCADEVLQTGLGHAPGLRVLNQQPFETLISFIISANNNIGRIRGIIERLCRACGTAFSFAGATHHAFPTPRQLAGMGAGALRECGCGYRAPYISQTAGEVAAGYDLDAIQKLPYQQAKKELTRFAGVGPKVADCVLLFAFSRSDAFPADVWIKRVLRSLYGFTGNDRQVYAFAKEKFGECAGIAQQYLFYYARENRLV